MQYVLVHGGNVSGATWNRLAHDSVYLESEHLGGSVWTGVSAALIQQGHQVIAPTLLDENQHNLSDHIHQICQLIEQQGLEQVVLVGHSYGGMVITGVIDHLAERIARAVYVDAAWPRSGESLQMLLAQASFDLEEVVGGTPKAYMEPLDYDTATFDLMPKTYIGCVQSEFHPMIKALKQRMVNESANWCYKEIDASHIPMADQLDVLVNALQAN